jgi:uncharacterized protein YjbI with pentapeptide repeats
LHSNKSCWLNGNVHWDLTLLRILILRPATTACLHLNNRSSFDRNLSHSNLNHSNLSHSNLNHPNLNHSNLSNLNQEKGKLGPKQILGINWQLAYKEAVHRVIQRGIPTIRDKEPSTTVC